MISFQIINLHLLNRRLTYTYTHRGTDRTDTANMHGRLLSQGKHSDISFCLFELQFKLSSIQLDLLKSCHSFFSAKYLSCSCSSSQYSGLYICYIYICHLDSFSLLPYSLSFVHFFFKVSKLNASPCSGKPALTCYPLNSSSSSHSHVVFFKFSIMLLHFRLLMFSLNLL